MTGNMLSGDIPNALLKEGSIMYVSIINILAAYRVYSCRQLDLFFLLMLIVCSDLSYNNFTLQGPDQPACQTNM